MRDIKSMKVIVTNADYKNALAAVRSLGKRGVEVTAASHIHPSVSYHTKYCTNKMTYSDPEDEYNFFSDILTIVKNNHYDVLLPVGAQVCSLISKYQNELKPYVKIPIVDYGSMQIACNKNETMKFANKNNILTPKTIYPESIEDVINISRDISYPAVIKAPEDCGSVQYAHSPEELVKLYKKVCMNYKSQTDRGKFPQVQEYIKGEAYGFFALFNRGQPRAIFAHKRLHEYPLTGGPSTMAQSIYNEELNAIGIKLLQELKWHGVAMVEFKRDIRDGKYKLIEINPKFWGSLDLAIASGVDFPYLACKMCVDGDIEPIYDYNKNVIFRWILPDLAYSLVKKSLKNYFVSFLNDDIADDLYLDDLKPTLVQCYKGMLKGLSSIKSRTSIHSDHLISYDLPVIDSQEARN